ncbi:MAG: hypothetical protein CL840_16485 [Crocinitomicaceae bacterium]|nr:hypothetical protein [Crocinitomicaceae bacterium]|tara:strand:+ start:2116 stop:2343 length:228 start_codon:yes stop_codon:yes gene_type:complete
MSKLNSLQQLKELKQKRKHELDLEKLKFENSQLRLKQEMNLERISSDIYNQGMSFIQNKLLSRLLSAFSFKNSKK